MVRSRAGPGRYQWWPRPRRAAPRRADPGHRLGYAVNLEPMRGDVRSQMAIDDVKFGSHSEGRGTPDGMLFARVRDGLMEPERVLALVLLVAFVTRAIWLALPTGALIFDEAFYVNAARVILGWDLTPGAHYAGAVAGLDPNTEHPPLGKLLMAASMAVFGDNGLGWRLPSLVAGMIALGALYKIIRATGESAWLGVLAVGLFAMDNLSLVHGRIGTLDMMVLAAILLSAWAALRGRWLAAGALAGLGLLVKLTALYGLLALLLMIAIAMLGVWRREHRLQRGDFRPLAWVIGGVLLVAGAGLWILDARFSSFTNPIDHVGHMFEYGAGLTRPGGPPTDCLSNDSAPWQWLANNCEMRYLRVATDTSVDSKVIATHASIDFRGAMNPVLLGAMSLAVPFAIWSAWRQRNRLAIWALIWIGANYLPYVALALVSNRITYIYYFLPVVPALSAIIALLLLRSGLPRAVQLGYVVVYLVGFGAYFPFRQIP